MDNRSINSIRIESLSRATGESAVHDESGNMWTLDVYVSMSPQNARH
jgi:hypothetical protein